MTSLDAGIRASDATRLVVRHAASLVFPLPLAYKERLERVPGVERVSWGNWFGGYYQDPKNQFTQFAVDAVSLFDLFPELLLPGPERETFLGERTSFIAGKALVAKYGWKIGDVIPITGTIYPGNWRLTLRGIYTASTPDADENTMMMAARERTTEIAVLKTLGFDDGLILRLVAAESMVLSLAGGILGCGIAFLLFRRLDFTAGGMIPNFRMLPGTLGMGLLLAV